MDVSRLVIYHLHSNILQPWWFILGYIWLYIFQMIPPLTVTTWWTPAAAHRLKVSCHAFAVLSQGVASQQRFGGAGRFGDNSRGGSHIIWLENPRHFFGAKTSVAMEKNQHTHFFGGKHTSCAMFNYDPFAYPSDCYPNFQIITVTKIEKLQFSTDYCGIVVCFSVFFSGSCEIRRYRPVSPGFTATKQQTPWNCLGTCNNAGFRVELGL